MIKAPHLFELTASSGALGAVALGGLCFHDCRECPRRPGSPSSSLENHRLHQTINPSLPRKPPTPLR